MAEAGEEWKTHACLPSLVVCTSSGLAKNKKHKKIRAKKKKKETSGLFEMMGLAVGLSFSPFPSARLNPVEGERKVRGAISI